MQLGSKRESIKEMIRKLHEGVAPDEVKREFRNVVESTTSEEIAQVEEELIREGMPREAIERLCEVHLAMFKESLEKEKPLTAPGHPVYILMEEHRILSELTEKLRTVTREISKAGQYDPTGETGRRLVGIIGSFRDSENHYLREENVLFPYLEKHGITQPPAIMWKEHDKKRDVEKGLFRVVAEMKGPSAPALTRHLEETSLSLAEILSTHFYKENSILFPTGLKVIGEEEWQEIRTQFDEIGYCPFTPKEALVPLGHTGTVSATGAEAGTISLDTGTFSTAEIEAILNALPVDITFVDKNDRVRYFSASTERIFVRAKAVIGRTVQQCHPETSIHVVNEILDDFRAGKRTSADFWINLGGKLILIRYFALRDQSGGYLGCLEVTQNITGIQKISGEKRLLD